MFLLNNNTFLPIGLDCHFLNENKYINENIPNLISSKHCNYINKIGKNKNKCCGRKKNKSRDYCYEHTWNTKKAKKNKLNKKRHVLLENFEEDNKINNSDQLINNVENIVEEINFTNVYKCNIDNRTIKIKKLENNIEQKCENPHNLSDPPYLITYYNDNKLFEGCLKTIKKREKRKLKKKKMKQKKKQFMNEELIKKEFLNINELLKIRIEKTDLLNSYKFYIFNIIDHWIDLFLNKKITLRICCLGIDDNTEDYLKTIKLKDHPIKNIIIMYIIYMNYQELDDPELYKNSEKILKRNNFI